MDRIQLGPAGVDDISESELLARIEEALAGRVPVQIITFNAVMCEQALRSAAFAALVNRAGLVVPESVGIAWALRLSAGIRVRRIPGIDLMDRLCALAARRGSSVYLLGAKEGIAAAAADELLRRHPGLKIAGTRNGYFAGTEEAGVIDEVRAARPDMLFAGLATPRQEEWIDAHLGELGVPVVMGVGGSFDVISGRLRRAPRWMRETGLEWLFRMLQQPRRGTRIAALAAFAAAVIDLRLKKGRAQG